MSNLLTFKKAYRVDNNEVRADFVHNETDEAFTVRWCNIHPSTGEVATYDIQIDVVCDNCDFGLFIEDCIRNDGEEENELYLELISKYGSIDCEYEALEPTFKIVEWREFTASDLDGKALTDLGGCTDSGYGEGLGDWMYQCEVEVMNAEGETKNFTIAFQPEERSNRMQAYSGYDLVPAQLYGYDADESEELRDFLDGDDTILDKLNEVATKAAKERFKELLEEL